MVFVWGDRGIRMVENTQKYEEDSFFNKAMNFLWQSGESGYQHVWPVSFSSFPSLAFCDFFSLSLYLDSANQSIIFKTFSKGFKILIMSLVSG